jgi:hypothetical protein
VCQSHQIKAARPGHTFYQHVVSANGLPLHVLISQASETDFTLSITSLDRLKKALKENGLDWKINNAVYDAGHDATGIYEYLMAKETYRLSERTCRNSVHFLLYLISIIEHANGD